MQYASVRYFILFAFVTLSFVWHLTALRCFAQETQSSQQGQTSLSLDAPTVRNDKLGRVTYIRQVIRDTRGTKLYEITRSKIKYKNATLRVPYAYQDTFSFAPSGSLKGTFSKGIYKLTGTVTTLIVGQKLSINRELWLDPSERFLIDPYRSRPYQMGNAHVEGFGEAYDLGNFTLSVLYRSKLKSGRLTKYWAVLYDSNDRIRTRVARTGISYIPKTNNIARYTEAFEMYGPDKKVKASLVGKFDKNKYLLSGIGPDIGMGAQRVNREVSVTSSDFMMLIDDPLFTPLQYSSNILTSIGDLQSYGNFQSVRYFSEYYQSNLTKYEQDVFDSNKQLWYKISCQFKYGTTPNKVIEYIAQYRFITGEVLELAWSQSKGLLITGRTPKGSLNLTLSQIRSNDTVFYSAGNELLIRTADNQWILYPLTTPDQSWIIPNEPTESFIVPGDRRLYVSRYAPDGRTKKVEPFTIKGVTWPVIGRFSNYRLLNGNYLPEMIQWAEYDSARLQYLGANVVQIDVDVNASRSLLPVLDTFYRRGILVILRVGILRDYSKPSPIDTAKVLTDVLATVNAYSHHPAILMWRFPDTWDYRYYIDNPWTFFQQLARAIKQADPAHAIFAQTYSFDTGVPSLIPEIDVWGAEYTDRPSAYLHWPHATPNPLMQIFTDYHTWEKSLYFSLSIERKSGVMVGGIYDAVLPNLMGAPLPGRDERAITSNFGPLRERYQHEYGPNLPASVRFSAQSGWKVSFKIDDQYHWLAEGGGGGGRGINVAVLDTATGTRLLQARAFDTWGNHNQFVPMAAYLDSLPTGSVVAIAIGDEGGFINYNTNAPWNDPYIEPAYRKLEEYGSKKIRTVPYWGTWAMIFKKGVGLLAETSSSNLVEAQAQIAISQDRDFDRR